MGAWLKSGDGYGVGGARPEGRGGRGGAASRGFRARPGREFGVESCGVRFLPVTG